MESRLGAGSTNRNVGAGSHANIIVHQMLSLAAPGVVHKATGSAVALDESRPEILRGAEVPRRPLEAVLDVAVAAVRAVLPDRGRDARNVRHGHAARGRGRRERKRNRWGVRGGLFPPFSNAWG